MTEIAQATGSSFNMFELTNVAGDEVLMCRVLADLLNPEGTHRQGRIYLDLFFDVVLHREKPIKDINVKREVVIEGDRRVDIVIKYDNCIIPIEVKINAENQPNQLYDYCCISWSQDILKWLDACISHYNPPAQAPMGEILIQFAAVVLKFTEQPEENRKEK